MGGFWGLPAGLVAACCYSLFLGRYWRSCWKGCGVNALQVLLLAGRFAVIAAGALLAVFYPGTFSPVGFLTGLGLGFFSIILMQFFKNR